MGRLWDLYLWRKHPLYFFKNQSQRRTAYIEQGKVDMTGENPRPFARYNNTQVKGPESTVTRRNNDFFLLHIDNGYVYYSVAKWEDCGISICEGNTLFTFLRTSHNDALRTSGRGKWIWLAKIPGPLQDVKIDHSSNISILSFSFQQRGSYT